jgi:hypothetical protein
VLSSLARKAAGATNTRRSLRPPLSRAIRSTHLAPNVSEERREGLTTLYGEQFRVYLREMGLDTELLDTVDHNAAQQHATEVPVSDWTRLHIVTSAPK